MMVRLVKHSMMVRLVKHPMMVRLVKHSMMVRLVKHPMIVRLVKHSMIGHVEQLDQFDEIPTVFLLVVLYFSTMRIQNQTVRNFHSLDVHVELLAHHLAYPYLKMTPKFLTELCSQN
jgi:hypothetical protein